MSQKSVIFVMMSSKIKKNNIYYMNMISQTKKIVITLVLVVTLTTPQMSLAKTSIKQVPKKEKEIKDIIEVKTETKAETKADSKIETKSTETPAPKKEEEKPKMNGEIDMSCVVTAVETREDSVVLSVDAFSTSVKTAILAHKTNLVTALLNTDIKARNTTRKAANESYRVSMKKAKNDFEIARKKIMSDFKDAIKECGKGAERAADLNETPFIPGGTIESSR